MRIGTDARASGGLGRHTATAPNGDMCLLQPQERLVRVFSPTGELRRTIGRRGAGPGEFQSLREAGWKADTFWVTDLVQRRINLIAPSGSYARTVPLTFGLASAMLAFDGSVVGLAGASAERVSRGLVRTMPLLRMQADGGRMDTLHQIEVSDNIWRIASERMPDGRVAYREQPFSATPLWTLSADGRFVLVVNRRVTSPDAEVVVTRMDLTGRVLGEWRLPTKPVALSSALVDSLIASEAAFAQRQRIFMDASDAQSSLRRSLLVPRYLPAIDRFFSARNGTYWMRLPPTGKMATWQVISATGRLLASIELPSAANVHDADDRFVWATARDSLDVESISRYAIRRP